MEPSGQQIIASTVRTSLGNPFAAINPATGATIEPDFHEASLEEVELAVSCAAVAFDDYRQISQEQKAFFLETIGDNLRTLGEVLVKRANLETALPEARLEGELVRTVNQLKFLAEYVRKGTFVEARIDLAIHDRKPLPKPDVRTMSQPLGPVAIFGASNFPLAFSVAGGDTASALAAGCPVVVKGHPSHPGTSELAARAIMQAVEMSQMPTGVFSMMQARGHEVGAALVQHPEIRAVAFTGSFAGGRALFDLASSRSEPVPVYAEMGSINPVFLLPTVLSENTETLAGELAASMTLGVGQFCTAPGLVILPGGAAADRFLGCLADCLQMIPPGTMLNTTIKERFLAGLTKYKATGVIAESIAGVTPADGCDVTPVLFKTNAKVLLSTPELAEEVFGPAALAVICSSQEEMLKVAESLPGQLTATVHGTPSEISNCAPLIRRLENRAGRLVFNGFPTGVEVCPSIHHGGPYPATTDSRSTSVGTEAVKRFLRPVCYQNFPQELLPEALRDKN